MTIRQFALIAAAGLALTACGGDADPRIARVCKVLSAVAAENTAATPDPTTVQMHVVMGIAGEFENELQELGKITANIDEDTKAQCPDARAAILKQSGFDSLAGVVR